VRGLLALLTIAAVLALVPPSAFGADALQVPREPPANGHPAGFRIDERQAVEIATATGKVREEIEHPGAPGALVAAPKLFGDDDWLIEYFRGSRQRVQVQLNGMTGKLVGAWRGAEIAWPPIAHGMHGPRARRLHKLLVLAGILFLLPFLDRRRPFRMLHLDLLAVLSLGVSYLFAARGNLYLSTPLMYPPLLYLLGRLVWLSTRARPEADAGRLTWMSPRALAIALVAVLVARYLYVAIDGQVNDVGYASLFGADSIAHGYPLYDSSPGSGHLDSYGPVNYLAYVPFTWIFGFHLDHSHAAAAQVAAVVFDLGTVAGLFVLGRRLRPGGGDVLGLALAFAFAACPWTLFSLSVGGNDGLVALILVWTLVAAVSPVGRGTGMALASLTKFAPLILAGLFLRVRGERGWRPVALYVGAFVVVSLFMIVPYLPDGGPREFYDSTIGFQFGRTSPFSIWGLHPWWRQFHGVFTGLVALMALASIIVPRERSIPRLAAFGAALLIAAQLTAIHWYYYYVPWFLPYAFVGLFSRSYAGSVRNSGRSLASAVASNSS
jgi:Glycosyltransferase family 87